MRGVVGVEYCGTGAENLAAGAPPGTSGAAITIQNWRESM